MRHLVELHGGTVHAASEGPGKGATFTVSLPIAAARPVSPEELRAKVAGGKLAPENPPSLAGVRALFVDDEADARELIAMMLAEGGAEVRLRSPRRRPCPPATNGGRTFSSPTSACRGKTATR